MDDLDFPSAEAVPPIPMTGGALPLSSGGPPRSTAPMTLPTSGFRTAGSRPGRYEKGVETRPLTPPSSSQNLQLVFDSSKIYDDHPRKYRLLNQADKDYASTSTSRKDRSQCALSSTNVTTKPSPPSVTVEDGRVVAMGATSSGPAAFGPSPSPDVPSPSGGAAPKSLATSAAGGAPFTLSEAVSSIGVKKEPGESRYVPQEFLKTFKAATTLNPPSDKKDRQRSSFSGISSPPMSPSSTKAPSSFGMPGAGFVHRPVPQIQAPERTAAAPGCMVVHPEPRRLFGIGPFYRPLPETICATGGVRRQSSPTLNIPTGLSEAVDKQGITGAGFSGSDSRRGSAAVDSIDSGIVTGKKKSSPTPAELNVWAPF